MKRPRRRCSTAFDLEAALRGEFRNLNAAFRVVAVTESEAAVIRTCYQGPVTVLGHTVVAAPTPRHFDERTGILFVGAIHGDGPPQLGRSGRLHRSGSAAD